MKLRVLLSAFLYGCLVFPASAAETATPPPKIWTIRQAVEFALGNSPDAGLARQRILGASAQIDQARAAFHPQLQLGAEYNQTDNPMYSFGNILNQGAFAPGIDFNDPGRTDNGRLQAQLQYRLYNGGKDQAAVDAAMAGKQAGQSSLVTVHAQLAFQVVRAFHTIIMTAETVDARESAIQAIQASVAVARARFEAGDLLETDLLNLEVQLSQAREQLIQARHHNNLARRGFLNLLGLNQGEVEIDPAAGIAQQVPTATDTTARPELREVAARIQATEAAVRQAEGGKLPSVDGFAGYQVDKGWETDGNGNSWLAGIKVNYDLYDGKRTSAMIAGAMATLAGAREEERKIRLGIDLEVQQARLALQEAEERLLVTCKMVEQTTESARLSRERFKEGVLLASEVIDAENRLTEALVRDVLARGDRSIAVADLRRALGLQQFEENTALQQ